MGLFTSCGSITFRRTVGPALSQLTNSSTSVSLSCPRGASLRSKSLANLLSCVDISNCRPNRR